MQNQQSGDVAGWLKRFYDIERDERNLQSSATTAKAFSDAASSIAEGASFEHEPSHFFALLHALAPEELKK